MELAWDFNTRKGDHLSAVPGAVLFRMWKNLYNNNSVDKISQKIGIGTIKVKTLTILLFFQELLDVNFELDVIMKKQFKTEIVFKSTSKIVQYEILHIVLEVYYY